MKARERTSEVSSKVRKSFSIGQPVRICSGVLAGLSGMLAGLSASGRASIWLQQDVYLDIDQYCLELENSE